MQIIKRTSINFTSFQEYMTIAPIRIHMCTCICTNILLECSPQTTWSMQKHIRLTEESEESRVHSILCWEQNEVEPIVYLFSIS